MTERELLTRAPAPPPAPAARLLPPPPVVAAERLALFLDFDGTLVDLADRPDGVIVGEELHALLRGLEAALPGRVAIVSGRSLAQLAELIAPLPAGLALAGSHGAELRLPAGTTEALARPETLDRVEAALARFAERDDRIVVERKTLGAGLHYRLAPEAEAEARALGAALAAEHGLVLQHGKMMVELRAAGDKGLAVERLMAEPALADAIPLMLGDDVTDEDGFRAASALGGAGVLVGPARDSAAAYGLADVAAVRRWLAGLLAA